MTDTENNTANEYNYYNETGTYIGQSEGFSPQEDLFHQAHYVFSSENETIKNGDTVTDIEKDIERYQGERLTISVSHIGRLMELNRKIEKLEKLLEQKKSNLDAPLKQLG